MTHASPFNRATAQAHLARAIRGVAFGLLATSTTVALTAPAAAQSISLPPPMAPCGDTHFNADRYRADLEARGWVFIPALNRATQIEALSQAFAALSVPDGTPPADIVAQARILWAARGEDAMIFTGGDQTLMISGVAADQGSDRAILCYLALPGRDDLDTAFDAALARGEGTFDPGPTQNFATTYADIRPGQTLTVTFLRPTPGTETVATAGFASRLDFPAGAN